MEYYRALKRKQAIKPWKVTQEPEMNTTKWMKPTWKGMRPTTQYCGKSKKIDSCQEGRAGHRIFRACEKTLYDIIVNTHHLYTLPTECTTPRMNPSASYGLWVTMMCHCRFINWTNVPLWQWAMHVWGQKAYGDSVLFV